MLVEPSLQLRPLAGAEPGIMLGKYGAFSWFRPIKSCRDPACRNMGRAVLRYGTPGRLASSSSAILVWSIGSGANSVIRRGSRTRPCRLRVTGNTGAGICPAELDVNRAGQRSRAECGHMVQAARLTVECRLIQSVSE